MAEVSNESSNENDLIPEINSDENASHPIPEPKSRPDLTKSVLFHGVTYLGSTSVATPRSEEELNKNMAILNEQSKMNIDVTLCVPDNADGVVRLLDPQTEGEISSYLVSQIIFCARGPSNSPLACCWAFTTSRRSTSINQNLNGKTQQEILYQCQIFRCENQDAIYRILLSFSNAFRRTTNNPPSNARRTTSLISHAIQATVSQLQQQTSLNGSQSSATQQQVFDGAIKFRCFFDIKEENIDSKGNLTFNSVSRPEKNVFNLRKNHRKSVSVILQQIRGTPMNIDRCFGLLLAQGRNVRASDMQLLDLETMGKGDDARSYVVRGYWNPLSRAFKDLIHLNEETPKGARVFFTVGLDIVINGISEPVRFLIEAKARIIETSRSNDTTSQDIGDTIWSSFKKVTQFTEEFDMIVKQVSPTSSHPDQIYEVVSLESKTEAERRSKLQRLSSTIPTNKTAGDDDESDEMIISGFGHVSKECDADVLNNWNEILMKWRKNYSERPSGLQNLVRKGVPEALRGEVWQLLAGSVTNEKEMIDTYRLLLTKESSSDRIIINDLNRTFPAHEYFKEQGGIGQESLYKLSRAYSVRDDEVGYCQGVSFVIATILIHMPEEQAFMLLCKLMEDERYLLREMYKANFENLQMKFYQLNCLIEEHLPDIYAHFYDLKVECHMFASQWFLTLFTAKFPLYLVFRIMDIFLYEGFTAIFAVALALLKCNQKDLLSLDFEGVMRFFRVSLPRKYLCEDHADELIQAACSTKLNLKKLKRYGTEFFARRAEEEQKQTPLQRLEVDNKRLTESCMRSEFENEMLALELVNDRIKLKERVHQAEDQIENLTQELDATKYIVRQSEELAIRLNEQLQNVREAFRDTCDELQQAQKSIYDYKQICSQLNNQLDKHKEKYVQKMDYIQANCCESCKTLIYSPSPTNLSTPDGETSTETNFSSIIPIDIANRLHRVEIELAEKKLALTQALCDNQELTRRLQRSTSNVSDSDTISVNSMRSTGSWLSKTVNSIKEAANSSNRTKVN
ncbi:unnamed protein product [Adineta ricciae]|uniref:Rab-GAP TBC domain-containing protein n=1 Tax=Adineta ricciae TaxID=249248 RepID=A0A815Z148_ADIRI|nr:unnamed protein product [Adineta ricciae]